jgi:DNA polymerase-3 subunit delta'
VLAALKRAAGAGTLAHAYLIVGDPRGAGLGVAESVLKLVLCESDDKPCGSCRGCRLVDRHQHPDVIWIEPEKKSRVIGVGKREDREGDPGIRYGLIEPLSQSTISGGWKAGVVLAADRMNDEAANAFLKTLEEPPPRTLILLVSAVPHIILPTIASRCQRIVTTGGETAAPEPWRSRFLDLLAAGCGAGAIGRLGMAARVAALFEEIQETAGDEVEAAAADDPDEDVLKARAMARFIEIRRGLLQELMIWQRDVLAAVLGLPDTALRNADRISAVRSDARGLGYADALERLRRIEDMDRQFLRNMSNEVVLSAFFRDLPSGT